MTLTADSTPPVSSDELARRVIEPSEFVADTAAFVDVRLPRSRGKASYSFIGPGVSQNADQSVNLVEPHGYNIGGASVPHGQTNNQHVHFTAEVFICTRGRWRMNVGEHADRHVEIGPGTVFAVPTWVFRGFTNVGDDDGFLFTVLGGDDTGGILWAPSVLREAAETGLYLAPDHSLRDATAGDPIDDVIEPLSPEQLAWVRDVTTDDVAACIVERDALQWSDRALLSHVVPGHSAALAPVLGHGMTEDRDQASPITTPYGFSLEWMRVEPGCSTGLHRHHESQVLFLIDGDWRITMNRGDEALTADPVEGSVVSVPSGVWRDFANSGTAAAHAVVVNGSDARTRLEWDDELVDAAHGAGWAHDASGYVAPAELLGRPL